MLPKITPREEPYLQIVELNQPVAARENDTQTLLKAELRRQMYERIARGNALAEVENGAHLRWRGE